MQRYDSKSEFLKGRLTKFFFMKNFAPRKMSQNLLLASP